MKQDKKGSHDGWQQFVIHLVDEHGDSIPDYVVDLYRRDPRGLQGKDLEAAEITEFDLDVHSYKADESFRCFHMRVEIKLNREPLPFHGLTKLVTMRPYGRNS